MADKTPKLDARIVQALAANGEANRDVLVALIDEATLTIELAQKVIEVEEPSLVDLENSDPDKSRELIASNKLKIERLTLALPQLQSRIDAIDAETALKTWDDEADRLREQSNQIFDELAKIYPPFLAKIVDLFDRGKRNVAAFQAHKRRAPPGADVWFEPATPHITFWQDIVLPSWVKPHVTFPFRQSPADVAWENQVAFTKAMVAQQKALDAKFAPNGGRDWFEVQKIEQERQIAADEKFEAEQKERDQKSRDAHYQAVLENERRHVRGEI